MKTLRDIIGISLEPSALSESALILIDCQNTYREGVMKLDNVEPALQQVKKLLVVAREHGVPVFHIQHDGGKGSPYDLTSRLGAIADEVAPIDGEYVIVKSFPNAFIQTSLDEALRKRSVENIILAGFMTHMCVNSTAHGGFNRGYSVSIVADATATRSLSLNSGKLLPAEQVQEVSIAATRDLYAAIIDSVDDLAIDAQDR
jgi:nicotinamidase-related amidase